MTDQSSTKQVRKKKYNADFFLHDSNAGNDPKVRALISKMGITGYGMLFMLYEKLAASDYFEISIVEDYEKENLVSMLLTSEDQLDIFLNYCVRFKLLVIEEGRLFSPGLKKRLSPLLDKRLKDNIRKSSNSVDSEVIPHGITEKSDSSARNSTDKKRKEKTKNNDIPPTPLKGGVTDQIPPSGNPDFNTSLLMIFLEEFEKARGFPYAITSFKGKEAKQINETYRKYLQMKASKGVIPSTEQALSEMRTFFGIAMQITDKWIYDNMSPGVLSMKFTTIATMMKENRNASNHKPKISDTDLEEIARLTGLQ